MRPPTDPVRHLFVGCILILRWLKSQNVEMALPFFKSAPEKQADHDRKVARCHKIIEEIQDRAERLQRTADDLPPDEADELCGQVELLLEAADETLAKVERLEQKR